MFVPSNKRSYLNLLRDYRKIRPRYEVLTYYLVKRLRNIADSLGMYPIISGRAKSLESFAEKVVRKGKEYTDPLIEVTDLCGVRIVLHTLNEVNDIEEAIRREFILDIDNSEDKGAKLAFREFGYLSRHFIIYLKEIPLKRGGGSAHKQIRGLKAELQIRTLAQHLWADIYHELGYRNEFQLPGHWEREFARLAAILENCDTRFQEIKNAMAEYESNYGNYMTPSQLQMLASRIEALIEIDNRNVKAVHRLIRVYLSLEGSEKKLRHLLKTYHRQISTYPPALRDLGVAYCKAGKPGMGQKLLFKALEGNQRDIDALSSLAGTYHRQGKSEKAIEYYRRAHQIDPTNPYPLANYIIEELLIKKDGEIISYFQPLVEKATHRCLKQVAVNVNLPWAYFDLGIFSLFLDNATMALSYYALGVIHSVNNWMIASAHSRINDFIKIGISFKGLDAVDKFLTLAEMAKTPPEERKVSCSSTQNHPNFNGRPVLILAGGCSGLQHAYQRRLSRLTRILRGFKGFLISGGTVSGIAKVAGDLHREKGITAVGYLPKARASETDNRYKIFRYTDSEDFSILDSLVFWEDFICGGGYPSTVKLIGFNGGKISSGEYRLALAFGAQVGIMKGSGRAADELINDPLWKKFLKSELKEWNRIGVKLFAINRDDRSVQEFLKMQ